MRYVRYYKYLFQHEKYIYKIFNILNLNLSFISDGMKDNYVFGEEEFIAYIRRSNDPIVIRYFNRNT